MTQRNNVAEAIRQRIQDLRVENVAFARFLDDIGRHGSWGIVGGAPRTWLLSPDREPRDIDIVANVDASMLSAIVKAAVSYRGVEASRTSLGGHRIEFGRLLVDVWSLSKTHSIEAGLIEDSNAYRAVAASAALSIDSLVVTQNFAVYERGFFATLQSGLIELLRVAPANPDKLASKAARLCREHRFTPDIPLAALMKSFGLNPFG